MPVLVAADWPVLDTPAFEVGTITSGGGWGGSDTELPRHTRLGGAGLLVLVALPTDGALEWTAGASTRASNVRWETGNDLVTTQVATTVDVGLQTQIIDVTIDVDNPRTFYPSLGARVGLAGTTLHASNEGTLTAFAPHLAVDGGVGIGEGSVLLKFGLSGDVIARTDAWGGDLEAPAGTVRWRINAGSASLRFVLGVEFRGE